MTTVYVSEQSEATRNPNARPGNDNARKHGLFSKHPPPLDKVKHMARQAAADEDWRLLGLVARHFRARGLVEEGRKLGRIARAGSRTAALSFADNVLQSHS